MREVEMKFRLGEVPIPAVMQQIADSLIHHDLAISYELRTVIDTYIKDGPRYRQELAKKISFPRTEADLVTTFYKTLKRKTIVDEGVEVNEETEEIVDSFPSYLDPEMCDWRKMKSGAIYLLADGVTSIFIHNTSDITQINDPISLGSYVEIEMVGPTSTPEAVKDIASKLGLDFSLVEPKSYKAIAEEMRLAMKEKKE